jgi:hypothetical protein
MAGTPENLQPEVPLVQERPEEFVIPETLKQSGVQVVQKTFKAQVKDNKGQPLIQTLPTQVITVQPPYDQTTLTSQSKGSISSSLTWLAAFWLRIIKKALYFGWRVIGKDQNVS